MTPWDLRAARQRLGLSIEELAALGSTLGARMAASARTVRRWEEGTIPVPASVEVVLQLALREPLVRRLLGIVPLPWEEGEGPQALEFPAIAPERPPIDPVPAFTLWPYGCRDSASCAHHRECMYVLCCHQDKDITARIDALTPKGTEP